MATGRLVDSRLFSDGSARSLLPGAPLHVCVLSQLRVPCLCVGSVELCVSAVNPSAAGWLRVWPCGSPEPETSSVNLVGGGEVGTPAAEGPVVVTGAGCVASLVPTEVVVDVSGWFDSALRMATGRLVDSRLFSVGSARSLLPGAPFFVCVLTPSGVLYTLSLHDALPISAVNPSAAGWLRVWPCGSPEPETSSVN